MSSATLTVLGSSDAFNASGRGHACYLLEDAAGVVTIDFGPTAMSALKRLGRDPGELDGVLITHLHGDHYGGLQTLLIDAYYRAFRTRPLLIAGPPGTRARIDSLFSIAYRTVSERPKPFPYEVIEFQPGETVKLLGREVTVLQADHQDPPREIACMLRIAVDGRVVSFSGDTGWTDQLVPLATGADLLVVECTFHHTRVPQHLCWEELGPALPSLGARRVLLTHLAEEMRDRAAVIAEQHGVLIAEDLESHTV